MSTFTLAIPVWPLPICLDSWTWHSRFLCNIAFYSIGPCFYQLSHLQLGIAFALAPSLHSFWSYFSTDLQWHIGHLLTWGVPLFSILSFCLFILFMGFSRQEYWSGLPFPSPVDHILSHLSTMTRPSWVAPQAWLSFIELDQVVVLVWLYWLVFCDYGFSVSALWCPLATPPILLGFLLPWVWGISSRLLQQMQQPLLLTLDEG